MHRASNVWYWIVPLLLLTWWLGARGLGADAIWWDEWRTIYRAGGAQWGPLTVPEVIQRMLAEDPNQSLGYPVLISLWGRAVGWTDVAARAFSLLAGIPVVALTYRLGTDMVNQRVGTLAAITIATSAFYITYLHELRTYSIYALFGALALWFYWRMLHSTRTHITDAIGLTLSIAGLLYMHYLGALLIGGTALYHLIFVRKTRRWWLISGSVAVGGVLFIPWAGMLLQAVNNAIEEGGRPDVALSTAAVLDQLFYALTNGAVWLLLLIVPGVLLALLRPTESKQRAAAVFTAFTFVATLALTIIAHEWLTILAHARYLLVLWVLFPLLVGLSLDRVATALTSNMQRGVVPAYAVLAVASCLWAIFTPTFSDHLLPDAYRVFFRPDVRWDEAGRILKDDTTPTDAVALSIDRHPWAVQGALDFYLYGLGARYTSLSRLDDDDAMHAFVAGAPRVWVVREQSDTPPDGFTAFTDIVQADYARCDTEAAAHGLTIDLYSRSAACCAVPEQPLIRYDGQPIELSHTEVLSVSDGAVEVLTQWAVAPAVPVNTYSVAYYLMDGGEIIAQVDEPLPHAPNICHITRLPLDAVPSGSYTLGATVYAWESGQRLTGLHQVDSNPTDLHRLTTVTIP